MPTPTQDLHLDFETYCDLDLKRVGVYRYTTHASFKVLCVAWKFEGQPVTPRAVILQHTLPAHLVAALQNPDVQTHAWNASFETAVLRRLEVVPANPLSCTMQRSLSYGLPAKLETAAAALGMAQQKDMAGHRLMRRMSRPLKPGAPDWTAADYARLAEYCARDVEAEAAVAEVVPQLQPDEAELSELDALMNTKGELGIDHARVCTLQVVAAEAEKYDAARCNALTGGAVTSPGTQTARLLKWLTAKGLRMENTERATIEEALTFADEYASEVVEVLQIRLRAARVSTRKLACMQDMAADSDMSLRGQFQFVGASRTGRWSGRGIQLQNLPRTPKGFSPDLFHKMAEVAITDDTPRALDAITPAPVLDCVSWSLRSCLKATDEHRMLWSFDFAQIEARVLAWLAGQEDILDVFRSGSDIYTWAAAQFGSTDRQLGKVLVLALGFGMGAAKLEKTARKAYGVTLTPTQAERFKSLWRANNPRIVGFWSEIAFAAEQAILRRGQTVPVGGSGIAFCCTARTLQMRLPSGRVLYYHSPQLDRDSGNLVYWGSEVGGRWAEQRTWGGKLAENATQAVARDVLAEAMLRVFRRKGLIPCLSVHDELAFAVCPGTHRYLRDLMLEPPPWAGGLPLAGESKMMRRYGVPLAAPSEKSPPAGTASPAVDIFGEAIAKSA